MVVKVVFPFVKLKKNLQVRGTPSRAPCTKSTSAESFEAKMKSFLRDSNERLHDLKRNTEGKRGGRGGRRD